MVEKRSETIAIKQRLSRLSFHFALPIHILYSYLESLTRLLCVVRHGTVPKVFQPGNDSGKSNNSAQSDGFAAAGLNRVCRAWHVTMSVKVRQPGFRRAEG